MVSFPPLIDMLKFSGYPYLIRGQKLKRLVDASVCYESRLVLRFNTKTLAANYFKASPNTRERTNTQHQAELEGTNDARTGMPHGIPRGAMCVQRFDDSLNSAIHTTYRISLRSSSMPEPRDPLLKVVIIKFFRR